MVIFGQSSGRDGIGLRCRSDQSFLVPSALRLTIILPPNRIMQMVGILSKRRWNHAHRKNVVYQTLLNKYHTFMINSPNFV